MEDATQIFAWLVDHQLSASKFAFGSLDRLHSVITRDLVINYFEEDDQDLEKVLDIFIRTNSGGTVLSYSDLLLSIATAQWSQLDARREIFEVVDELNSIGSSGFEFSKDFVLKAGLMLADIASVGFRVENFNAQNMAKLEGSWPAIRSALTLAVHLAASFGFSGRTLSADNSLLPIAYYLYQRKTGFAYLTSRAERADRDSVRGWLVRSLLKTGVWGSGLDTLLTAVRGVLRSAGGERFPVELIEDEMARRGKPLRFTSEELEDLTEVDYNDRRTVGVLSLLYPFLDLRNQFHVDHVFARSRFTPRLMKKDDVPQHQFGDLKDWSNRLPNLQLLQGSENVQKQAKMPLEWAREAFLTKEARDAYVTQHDLPPLSDSLGDFATFYKKRRKTLLAKLQTLLGQAEVVVDDSQEEPTRRSQGSAKTSFFEQVLAYRPLSESQRTLLQILLAADPDAVTYKEAIKRLGAKSYQGIGAVLAGFGRRANSVSGSVDEGSKLLFVFEETERGWTIGLLPEFAEFLRNKGDRWLSSE
jgi:hypothetical protein